MSRARIFLLKDEENPLLKTYPESRKNLLKITVAVFSGFKYVRLIKCLGLEQQFPNSGTANDAGCMKILSFTLH